MSSFMVWLDTPETGGYVEGNVREIMKPLCMPKEEDVSQAYFEWYTFGGSWPYVFLVKEDCPRTIRGGLLADALPSPGGYIWVAGARKSDVDWNRMKQCIIADRTKKFAELEQWFSAGELPEDDPCAGITEDGIAVRGEMLYVKRETLAQFLERYNLGADCKYPCRPHGFIQNGVYHHMGPYSRQEETAWRRKVQTYLESIPENHFIISLECWTDSV